MTRRPKAPGLPLHTLSRQKQILLFLVFLENSQHTWTSWLMCNLESVTFMIELIASGVEGGIHSRCLGRVCILLEYNLHWVKGWPAFFLLMSSYEPGNSTLGFSSVGFFRSPLTAHSSNTESLGILCAAASSIPTPSTAVAALQFSTPVFTCPPPPDIPKHILSLLTYSFSSGQILFYFCALNNGANIIFMWCSCLIPKNIFP